MAEKREVKLVLNKRRAEALAQAEIKRDADERHKLDEELAAKRAAFESGITELRKIRLAEIDKNYEDERSARLEKLRIELEKERETHDKQLAAGEQILLQRKVELDILAEELKDVNFEKRRLKSRAENLDKREQNLDREVEQGMAERIKTYASELDQARDECKRLRESIRSDNEMLSIFDELQRRLGGKTPEELLKEFDEHLKIIKDLRQDLLNRPAHESLDEIDRIRKDREALNNACIRLSEENRKLKESMREVQVYEAKIEEQELQISALAQKKDYFELEYKRVDDDLKRLQSSYKRKEEQAEREKAIEAPFIEKERPRLNKGIGEIDWLTGLEKSIKNYGFVFPQRLLYAFHTALKTAEMSTITVLAGVSGTGKSELPRLYSHFGGINFLSLPVQPNWDSKESMLGFFNTIEGKFDAQPVLRFLAQSQKQKTADYPLGLADTLNIILLDEMNLAHVELYFAEFLSKLEERRGRSDDNVPSLAVKLGSGMKDDYMLPMGRNVLWVGTMNQDETTKSLSDKVLDRGIVINFPRPLELIRREEKTLPDPAPLISKEQWESWKRRDTTFFDDCIKGYKCFIEEINGFLAKSGRSYGNRVWQSIEQYMANYPGVLSAEAGLKKADQANDEEGKNRAKNLRDKMLKTAFEDQLVQKVMPKLRGIETSGAQNTNSLIPIRRKLEADNYTIVNDFNNACNFGDGQFIWNSSNYLNSAKDLDDGGADSETEDE